MKLKLLSVALLLAGAAAQAHVVLDEPVAMAGVSYRASLRVTHGCAGSPTTAVRVLIPAGFQGAKPLPKAGWNLVVKKEKLDKPYLSHGREITQDAVEITWTAASRDHWLPNEFYDEFVLRGSLQTDAAVMWFKVLQTCEKGVNDWSQVPPSGTSTTGLGSPAALLEIIPSTQVGHQH